MNIKNIIKSDCFGYIGVAFILFGLALVSFGVVGDDEIYFFLFTFIGAGQIAFRAFFIKDKPVLILNLTASLISFSGLILVLFPKMIV